MMILRSHTLFLRLFFLMALMAACPFSYSRVQAAEGTAWQLLKETANYTIYIDTASIETTPDISVKVMYKTIAKSNAYRELLQDIRSEEGRSVEGYDKFAYTLSRVEIDCSGDRHRLLEATDYDKHGRPLGRPLPKEDWKKTHPDTSFAALAAWVCEDHPLLEDSPDAQEGDD